MKVKDAASLILVDKRQKEPRLLMGRRAAKHKFMPNIYVFPGGRVDYCDRYAPLGRDYTRETLDLLLQKTRQTSTPLKARMLGFAALRETFEEVGLKIGSASEKATHSAHPSWAAFCDDKLRADLARLTFIVRAITPPGQTRRFDTRFFMVDASKELESQTAEESEELEDLRWVTIAEASELPLHFITKRVLKAVEPALHLQHQPNVAFYRAKRGSKDVAKILTELRPGEPPLPSIDISTA